MRAPEFWQSDGLVPRLLDPLGRAYGLIGTLRRRLAAPEAVSIPVICIGNLTAGGAGKTPTVIALAKRLLKRGEQPHMLTRGYGGRMRGPLLVDPSCHDSLDVGDEALLLARTAPTWISRDRVAGARAAAEAGAGVIVMDDGLQNPHLVQDLSLVVVDNDVGFGNQRLIPAGPLREKVEIGLARASGLVAIGGANGHQSIEGMSFGSLPWLQAEFRPAADGPDLNGKRVVAFAGIGRPGKFFKTLQDLGADVVQTRSFPDHHRYNPSEIEALLEQARQVDASCVTTEKDHVRIPLLLGNYVKKLPIELHFASVDALDKLISTALTGR